MIKLIVLLGSMFTIPIIRMVACTVYSQIHWVSGLYPSCSIKKFIKHSVLETDLFLPSSIGRKTASVVQWSEILATDPEARVRFLALPEKKSSGSGTGFTQPREYN
jgi:hypothetical protein